MVFFFLAALCGCEAKLGDWRCIFQSVSHLFGEGRERHVLRWKEGAPYFWGKPYSFFSTADKAVHASEPTD